MFISRALVMAAVAIASPGAGAHDDLEKMLAKAEATWTVHKPEAYEFIVDVRCFCPLVRTPPAFRVKNGMATPLSMLPPLERQTYAYFDTVEKLFTVLREKAARKPVKMLVQYDPEFGYPISADIDVEQTVVDDELSFRVIGFKVLPDRAAAFPAVLRRPH